MAESSWEALLWSFLAVDNVTRNAAEAHFAILKQASCSDELLLGLVHVIHSTSPDDIRALAAVLLRRVLLRDTVSLWPRATEQTRHIIKKELVAILAAGEKNRSIRRKVCDTVGELASSILEDGQWDSLFPTLLQWSKASIVFLREAALRILEMIAVVLASQISQSTLETIGTSSLHSIVLDILSKGLQDREGRVALNSLRALSMVLLHLDALEQSFRPEVLTAVVVPSLQQILYNCLEESVRVTKSSTSGLKPLPTACSSATLGGIALECLSLIGQAVGKHVFARDAASILKVMAEMQATPSILNNELIRTYLLQAWARC